MEQAISVTLSPIQAVLALAFQAWIFVIFPVIIIRKLNYMTNLLHDIYDSTHKDSSPS